MDSPYQTAAAETATTGGAKTSTDATDVNMYRGRSRSRSRSRSPPPRRDHPATATTSSTTRPSRHPITEPTRVLGVFGLSFETRESDLRALFEKYGELEQVNIVHDKRSGQSRGFGFIYFKEQAAAERAVPETNGISFLGRNIRVDFSATTKPHDPTPGRYMGEVTRRDEGRRDRGDRGGSGRRRSRSRDRYRRSSRSRSRSPGRRSYYPPPSSSHGTRDRYPDRYRPRSRSRSVERRHTGTSSYSRYSPRRRSPSPRRAASPRRYSPRR